jgi:hypothetical protein
MHFVGVCSIETMFQTYHSLLQCRYILGRSPAVGMRTEQGNCRRIRGRRHGKVPHLRLPDAWEIST